MDKELRIRYILDKSQFDPGIKGAHRDLQDTTKHLDAGAQSARNFGREMLAIVGVQAGMGLVQQAVGAINSSMQEAAEYTKRVAEAFGVTRDAMREIAAIQGKGLTNQFVGEQLDLIGRARIVTSKEGIEGLNALQEYGSGYVGDGPDSRVSQESVNNMLPTVMETAKRLNLGQKPAMQMFASVIQSMPKGTSEKGYMDTFAKMVAESLDSKGSATTTAKNVAPVLAESAGEGGAFGESAEGVLAATRWVNTLSESNPAQAGMLARNVMKEFETDDLKGKNEELGIDHGMSPDEKLVAMRDKWRAETGGKEEFSLWYSKKVGRVGNMRSLRGLDVLIRKGLEGGFFDRMTGKAEGASLAKLQADNDANLGTEGGAANRTAAATDLGEARRGSYWSPVTDMKRRAEAELTTDPDHPFDTWRYSDAIRKAMHPTMSIRDQLIDERALQDAQADARSAGADAYPGQSYAPDAAGYSPTGLNQELKRLNQLTEQANAQRARQVPAVPPTIGGRPTVAPQGPR